jgi:hypothetical protein
MKPLSRTGFVCIATVLAVLMLATRVSHMGDALHLPDASMAVFFLGGLYLRRHLAFVAYLLLAVLIDWAVITYAGVSNFCVTVAYAFLLPAYATLWYGGRLYAERLDGSGLSLLEALGVALVSASVCFAISNGSFYWLGGRYPHPDLMGYFAGVWRWGPRFVRVTLGYVVAGLLVHVAVQALAKRFHVGKAAHA